MHTAENKYDVEQILLFSLYLYFLEILQYIIYIYFVHQFSEGVGVVFTEIMLGSCLLFILQLWASNSQHWKTNLSEVVIFSRLGIAQTKLGEGT